MDMCVNDAISLLKELTLLETSSDDKKNIDIAVDFLEEQFKKMDMTVSRLKQDKVGDFLECHFGSGDKKILLLGHLDTVYPVGTISKTPFKEENGMIFGPGVLDMKGGIVVLIFALKELLKSFPPNTEIVVFINTDEEIGSIYSREHIEQVSKNSIACMSFEGAPPGTLTTQRKGILSFDIEVFGEAAHAGSGEGKSAIEEMVYKLHKIFELKDFDKEITVNFGFIQGGTKRNVTPSYARAEGEIRYLELKREDLLNKIENILNETIIEGTKTVFNIVSDRPPWNPDQKSRKLFEIAQEEANKMGKNLSERKSGGGGDVAFVSTEGVPAIDGLGPEGRNSHSEKEFIIVESIPFKIELTKRIIFRIAKEGIENEQEVF